MRLPDDLVLKFTSLQDQYFDLRGLSVYSALSVSCIRGHIKSNGLPCYLLKGKTLVRKSEFDAWLQRFRVKKSQDLDSLADEIIAEIGSGSRRSRDVTT